MSLREISDVMHTDNEILAPDAIDDPALGVVPGPQCLRRDIWNACQGVDIWFSK